MALYKFFYIVLYIYILTNSINEMTQYRHRMDGVYACFYVSFFLH